MALGGLVWLHIRGKPEAGIPGTSRRVFCFHPLASSTPGPNKEQKSADQTATSPNCCLAASALIVCLSLPSLPPRTLVLVRPGRVSLVGGEPLQARVAAWVCLGPRPKRPKWISGLAPRRRSVLLTRRCPAQRPVRSWDPCRRRITVLTRNIGFYSETVHSVEPHKATAPATRF